MIPVNNSSQFVHQPPLSMPQNIAPPTMNNTNSSQLPHQPIPMPLLQHENQSLQQQGHGQQQQPPTLIILNLQQPMPGYNGQHNMRHAVSGNNSTQLSNQRYNPLLGYILNGGDLRLLQG